MTLFVLTLKKKRLRVGKIKDPFTRHQNCVQIGTRKGANLEDGKELVRDDWA